MQRLTHESRRTAVSIGWPARLGVLAVTAVLVAACGGSGETPTVAATPEVTPEAATPAPTPVETPTPEPTADMSGQNDGGIPGDAGDSLAEAREVKLGIIGGALVAEDEDREDFFVVVLPLDAVLTLSATAPLDLEGSLHVSLFFDGTQHLADRVGPGGSATWPWALVNPEGARLFVRVAEGRGNYTIELAAESQPDGGSPGDADEGRGVAKEIEPGAAFDGVLIGHRSIDVEDWYRWTADSSGPVEVEFSLAVDSEGDVRFWVSEEGRDLANATVPRGASETLSFDVTEGTTYELRVRSGTFAFYSVTFPTVP